MIFNSVVSSALKHLGNFSPFIAVASVHKVENPLLLLAPADLLDLWVQVIVPSLPALFTNATW